MNPVAELSDENLLQGALRSARDTRAVLVDRKARLQAPQIFHSVCGSSEAVVVADENTFSAAGREVCDAFRLAGQSSRAPIILSAAEARAEYSVVEALRSQLAAHQAVPVAVGSGTINDLVKLASHEVGRRYVSVATAASMDGYTAFGASITRQGSKETFACPAPLAVVADLDVIAAAPEGLNAAGYADLIAKCPAGADWLLAEALGEEPRHEQAWDAVQQRLPTWVSNPAGIRNRDLETLRGLTHALLMTGFAMQMVCSSRPASGAEHQFSHLWDMQHHTYQGNAPSHGFKVGIGTLASTRLYEVLATLGIDALNIDEAVEKWPDQEQNDAELEQLFQPGDLLTKATIESREKHVGPRALREQLVLLRRQWPKLRKSLAQHLIPAAELKDMLREAGCPFESEQIGIDRPRLRLSYRQAYHIRRRFTVLDCARRCGMLEPALDAIFS